MFWDSLFFSFFPLNGIFPYKGLWAEFFTPFPLLKLYQSQFRVSEDVHSDFNSEWNSARYQESNSFSLQIIASNHRGENVPSLLKYIAKNNAEIAGGCLSLWSGQCASFSFSLTQRQIECVKTVSYSLKRGTKGSSIIN